MSRSPHLGLRRLLALVTVVLLGLTAACSSSAKSSDGKPTVVASTSVWAAVARAVAGDHADVTAVLDNPQQDPHSYEPTAQDKLSFARATVAIVNGGGYDDWASTLTSSDSTVINAVTASDLPGAGGAGFNEHVWYSPATAQKVAEQVSSALEKADPAHAADYQQNLKTFTAQVGALIEKARLIGQRNPGAGIVATEPVGAHLFELAGIADLTPSDFVDQSESDAGPSVSTIKETTSVLTSGKARALAINPQTSDPVADTLISAAKSATVPTFDVYELLPQSSMTYVDFLQQAIDSLTKALAK